MKIPSFAAALWNSDAIENDGSGEDEDHRKPKKRKHRSDDSEEDKISKKKRSKDVVTSEESDSSEDNSSRKKSKRKRSKGRYGSESDQEQEQLRKKTMRYDDLDTSAGNSVYRALKESTIPFAWTESPCGVCPSFEFCKPGGPVNPQECSYYGDWLLGGTVSNEIEESS